MEFYLNDMRDQAFHSLMYKVSRLLIFLPVVFIGVALVAKSSWTTSKTVTVALTPTPIITFTPTPTVPEAISIDLKGPVQCQYTETDATMSASLKDSQVLFNIQGYGKDASLLLKGDCVYKWEAQTTEGIKTCGVGKYVTMFGPILKSGTMTDKVFSTASSYMGIEEKKLRTLMKSCQSATISSNMFAIPTKVSFKATTF
ncbi:hypothetical protein HGB07_04645 [Candidatus Roizmanbacteria bacterium]|nr:hypothetical protein [Candidatus Roizmanbacteria bacterium]